MYLNTLNSDRVRRDGLNVFNFRGKTAPLVNLPGLQLNGELALEENGSKVRSALGGYVGIGYEFAELPWKPRVSYRFAGFSGDRRGKGTDKAFDPLFYGQSDWGTWFQGEILGNYIAANSNLLSWLLRLNDFFRRKPYLELALFPLQSRRAHHHRCLPRRCGPYGECQLEKPRR